MKVVSRDQLPADQWTHVAVTYDGSSKAAGVKVYLNGQSQADECRGRHAQGHDPHQRAVQARPAAVRRRR